jgi:outer membrane protein TolC
MLISIIASSALQAQDLKQIINSSLQNNHNIKSLQLQDQSKEKTYDSVSNIYNPSVIVGANYTKLDIDQRSTQVGSTGVGFVKLGINLYDGGRNEAIKKQKFHEYQSSLLNTTKSKKELILQIVTLFYQAKSIDENIKALNQKANTLNKV